MATTDEITAAVETAQTSIGEALGQLITDTGVKVDAIEIVDATTEPPTVKITVSLAVDEEGEPEAPAEAPTTIDGYFGQ